MHNSDYDTFDIDGIHATPNGLVAHDYTMDSAEDFSTLYKILGRAIHQTRSADTGSGDKPTVFLLGELHDVPAYALAEICALDNLQTMQESHKAGILCAYERPSTTPQNMAELYNFRLPSRIYWALGAFDRDGQAALAALSQSKDAPINYSRRLVYQKLLQAGIPTLFNDAARQTKRQGKEIIDPDTPFFDQAMQDCVSAGAFSAKRTQPPAVQERDGMNLRNRIMFHHTEAEVRQRSLTAIFQICGLGHIFGQLPTKTTENNVEIEHSLAAQFANSGYHVVPIIIKDDTSEDLTDCIDPRAWSRYPDTVIIRGVSALDNAEHDDANGIHDLVESRYVHKLKEAYSGTPCPFDPVKLGATSIRAGYKLHNIVKQARQAYPGKIQSLIGRLTR